MNLNGILIIVFLGVVAAWIVWKVGFGKQGLGLDETSTTTDPQKEKVLQEESELLKDEANAERYLSQLQANQQRAQDLLDQAINEMVDNVNQDQLPAKEAAEATHTLLQTMQKEIKKEESYIGFLETEIKKEKKEIYKLPRKESRFARQFLNEKRDTCKQMNTLIKQKEQTLKDMIGVLIGWTAGDPSIELVTSHVADLDQHNSKLKNIRVQQIKLHEVFAKEQAEETAALAEIEKAA